MLTEHSSRSAVSVYSVSIFCTIVLPEADNYKKVKNTCSRKCRNQTRKNFCS